MATYLLYTIYEANYDLRSAPSFYTELGIPVTAADREIKSRFRRLAALHHPDKAGASNGGGDAAASSAFFIHLKTASDTLQDAAKRYAYERFGPAMLAWSKCVTVRDFVTHGVVYTILPYYAVAAATIYAFGLLGYMDFAKFYRWLLLVTLCLLEVTVATRPSFPAPLGALNAVLGTASRGGVPPYLPFELVHLARKITLTVYIALSQIGPIITAQLNPHADKGVEDEDKALQAGLLRLEGLTRQMDADAARLIDMELTPFKGDEEMAGRMRTKMREWLINNTIRSDPMVKDALGNSFQKRRIDAPAGAKGTR